MKDLKNVQRLIENGFIFYQAVCYFSKILDLY